MGPGGEKFVVATIAGRVSDLDLGVELRGVQGLARRLQRRGWRGYHWTFWSSRYAGSGCARAYQSGTAPASPPSDADGPRAGAVSGGRAGSPMRVRMRATGVASVMKARMCSIGAVA
jgi:hypothetical protein